jgi:hypothetical protein
MMNREPDEMFGSFSMRQEGTEMIVMNPRSARDRCCSAGGMLIKKKRKPLKNEFTRND